jgi:N6-L-threonylcarbamoyladenine synthase
MLVLVESGLKHRVLGGTIDDAAGECFDKTGKLMDVPAVSSRTDHRQTGRARGMPVACWFSASAAQRSEQRFQFSGLKTSMRYLSAIIRRCSMTR